MHANLQASIKRRTDEMRRLGAAAPTSTDEGDAVDGAEDRTGNAHDNGGGSECDEDDEGLPGYLDSDEEYDEDNDDDYECLEEEDVDESEGEPYWRLP